MVVVLHSGDGRASLNHDLTSKRARQVESTKQEAGRRKLEAGSWKQGAGSRTQKAESRKQQQQAGWKGIRGRDARCERGARCTVQDAECSEVQPGDRLLRQGKDRRDGPAMQRSTVAGGRGLYRDTVLYCNCTVPNRTVPYRPVSWALGRTAQCVRVETETETVTNNKPSCTRFRFELPMWMAASAFGKGGWAPCYGRMKSERG